MTIHDIRVDEEYFKAILSGKKTFEIRRNRRDYKAGDILILHEKKDDGCTTGNTIMADVPYILPGGRYGLAEDYVAMSIVVLEYRHSDETNPRSGMDSKVR